MISMDAVELVATVTTPLHPEDILEIPTETTWLQIRADVVDDVPADGLRKYFPGKLLYSLRSEQAGGKFDGLQEERRNRLIAAAKSYDLVELEADSDLVPEVLAAIPSTKRLISCRVPVCDVSQLQSGFQKIATFAARYYCMNTTAARTSEGLQTLLFLQALQRKDVVARCDGPSGLWSRLLAPYFGAPLLFAQLDHEARALGELHLQQLIADYGFPVIRPIRELYGMVGNRLFQSPSPRLHNAAYRELDHPALFLPFHVERFEEFWREIVQSADFQSLGMPIRGLVIVSPHKEAAISVANASSSMVRKAAASNIFVHRNDGWEAETTDPESIAVIRQECPPRAAVIGCGGAGRAVAAALQQAGSDVTLVNRGLKRGEYAVELLGLPFVPLSEFRAEGFDLIVNATPVGRDHDGFPFITETLSNDTLVIDLAYGAEPTPLVSAVQARGGTAIDGHDVLLTQVRKQFQLMTGMEMPASIGRETVLAGNAANFVSPVESRETQEAYECSL
jgi:3-dehydroquinate dehydratase/shikimate dehydrogenase